MATPVQIINCANKAAFVMFYQVYYKNPRSLTSEHLDWTSGNYHVNETKTCDLSNFENVLEEGASIWIRVNAILGQNHSSNKDAYTYSKNGASVNYVVKGTTWDYTISVE